MVYRKKSNVDSPSIEFRERKVTSIDKSIRYSLWKGKSTDSALSQSTGYRKQSTKLHDMRHSDCINTVYKKSPTAEMVRTENWGFGDKPKYRHCKLKKKPIVMRTETFEAVMTVQLHSFLTSKPDILRPLYSRNSFPYL